MSYLRWFADLGLTARISVSGKLVAKHRIDIVVPGVGEDLSMNCWNNVAKVNSRPSTSTLLHQLRAAGTLGPKSARAKNARDTPHTTWPIPTHWKVARVRQ